MESCVEVNSQFFSLIESYISNLSLLLSLEPSEKFVVVGGGWWWVMGGGGGWVGRRKKSDEI